MTTAQDFSKYQETRLEGSPHRRVGEVPGHQPRGPDTQTQIDQCKREGTVKVCAMPCRAMSLSSDTSIDHLLLQLFNSNREIAPAYVDLFRGATSGSQIAWVAFNTITH